MSKRGQVTAFVIIALVLIAGFILYFIFRDSSSSTSIPSNLEPVYSSFIDCMEEQTKIGVAILGFQGGYIDLPEFVSGSTRFPFGSHLDIGGSGVPYWYYVSGSGNFDSLIPTKKEMENQLKGFLEEGIHSCNYQEFYPQGFLIDVGQNPIFEVKIDEEKVDVAFKLPFLIERENESVLINSHKFSLNSDIGKLYDNALEVYDFEEQELFLENLVVDTMRLNAPVDGVELTCSPLIWTGEEVISNLQNAIEQNILALKVKGGDYTLNNPKDNYFVQDISLDNDLNVLFLNSKNWTYSYEINPTSGGVLIAEPSFPEISSTVGFCYVSYHFVYDVKIPVLIQLTSNAGEIFQFAFAVVIQGNTPREPIEGVTSPQFAQEVCSNALEKEILVNVYDYNSNPIKNARVSYQCLGDNCYLGETGIEGSSLMKFPQCANGLLLVQAEGYQTSKEIISGFDGLSFVDVYLKKEQEKKVVLNINNREYNSDAIVSFNCDDFSKSIYYPMQDSIALLEGSCEVSVIVYRNSTLSIPKSNVEKCVEVPRSGVSGIFGLTEEECYDIEIPAQNVENALFAGGKETYYFSDSELQNSNTIILNVESLPSPTSLEQLQDNYILFEDKGVDVRLS